MSAAEPARTLAVLLHADVVGSTALVQLDETLAHTRVQQAYQQLAEMVRAYGGTVHEVRGDALVAEFRRASDAVSAALAFQQHNTARNQNFTDAIIPSVRIGISLGEVVFADGSVTGPGIVLAQRVEQLAEPNGVCVTAAIREAAPSRLPFDYADLGVQEVKGFDQPAHVYAASPIEGSTIPPADPQAVESPLPARRGRTPAVVVVALVLAIGAGLAAWQPWLQRVDAASVARMKFPLPDKPSVAVLPLVNQSADPDQELLADAITDDVITNLAQISGLFVIAGSSSSTYKGKAVKVQQVAEELGVRYVVEGSLRRSRDQLRVSVQLIDAISGHHMWTGRFDRETRNIFELQDDITRAIASELAVTLAWTGASHRSTESVDAYLMLRRIEGAIFATSPNQLAAAISSANRAIDLDPGYARAYALLAFAHSQRGYFGFDTDRQAALQRGIELSEKAIELDSQDWYTNYVHGQALMNVREYERGLASFDRAIALNPANAQLLAFSTLPLIFLGRPDEAISRLQSARRMNPFYHWHLVQFLGQSYYLKGEYAESVRYLEESASRNPEFLGNWWWRAAAYAKVGRLEEARTLAAKILRRRPGSSISGAFIRIADQAMMEDLRAGWRLAGLPD